MMQHGINALIFISAIVLSLSLGRFIAHYCGGLPGSLYGMLLFCALLHSGWVPAKRIQLFASQCIQYMPIVFLPICVGVITYSDMIQTFGIKLLIIGIITTFSTMTLVAFIANIYLKNRSIDNNLPNKKANLSQGYDE